MAFYTIINLNDYKTNPNNGKIKLTDIFNDGGAESDDIINSKNTDSYQGFYNFTAGTLKAGDQSTNTSLQSFDLKGRTIDQHLTGSNEGDIDIWVTNNIGNFSNSSIQAMKKDIIANNKIGFGHGIGSSYQEFGDQIIPGPQSGIKGKDSAAFFVGVKGATGGGGGAGGGNYWQNKRGGAGGQGGSTYGVWVYPKSTNTSKITEQDHTTGLPGGLGGGGGEWGYEKGYGGAWGKNGGNTRLNFQHKKGILTENITFRITGSGGGGGGEGAGRGGGNGANGADSYVDFQSMNVTDVENSYGFLKSNPIAGGQGAPESGKSKSGGSGQPGAGSKDADGISGATFIYLAGSKANHSS